MHSIARCSATAVILCAPITQTVEAQSRTWILKNPQSLGALAYDRARGRAVGITPTDTFESDGRGWTPMGVNAFNTPHGLSSPAAVYDDTRGTVLVSGGWDSVSGVYPRATWRWNGAQWQLDTALPQPSGADAGMAYDRGRGRAVLFGGREFGSLAETWEWDGARWAQRLTAATPAARFSHAMGYDTTRGVTVLFGGFGSGPTNPLRDTWEWDGTTWILRSASGPPGGQATMAFDETRARMVLLTDGETWEWDGSTWRGGPTVGPSAGEPLAFVPATGRVSVFEADGTVWSWDGAAWSSTRANPHPPGLFNQSRGLCYDVHRRRAVTVHDGETWEYDGANWQRVATSPQPMPQFGYSLAYDPRRRRAVLFGGFTAGIAFAATWEWDGSRWQQMNPTTVPSARYHAPMAWDPVLQRIVLGGADMWSYDGTTWTRIQPSSLPPDSVGTMVTDTRRQRVVFIGASGTWEWDGTAWSRLGAAVTSGAGPVAAAYDPDAARVVAHAFGGAAFAWDGSSWQQVATGVRATARLAGPMVFDHVGRTTLLLADGATQSWILSGSPASVTRSGDGCGATTRPDLRGWSTPALGSRSFKLDLVDAPATAPAVAFFSPASAVTSLGGGCTAWIDLTRIAAVVAATTDPLGITTLDAPIPLLPRLLAQHVHVQAAVPDPAASIGIALTNALDLRIGH